MEKSRRRLVDELYAVSREHDSGQADRVARFRNVAAGLGDVVESRSTPPTRTRTSWSSSPT